jgi:hypothetical protein
MLGKADGVWRLTAAMQWTRGSRRHKAWSRKRLVERGVSEGAAEGTVLGKLDGCFEGARGKPKDLCLAKRTGLEVGCCDGMEKVANHKKNGRLR